MKRWVALWTCAGLGVVGHALLAHGLCAHGAGVLLAAGAMPDELAALATLALVAVRLAGLPLLSGLVGLSLAHLCVALAARTANRVAPGTPVGGSTRREL
jgi:hypothetical protein